MEGKQKLPKEDARFQIAKSNQSKVGREKEEEDEQEALEAKTHKEGASKTR